MILTERGLIAMLVWKEVYHNPKYSKKARVHLTNACAEIVEEEFNRSICEKRELERLQDEVEGLKRKLK